MSEITLYFPGRLYFLFDPVPLRPAVPKYVDLCPHFFDDVRVHTAVGDFLRVFQMADIFTPGV